MDSEKKPTLKPLPPKIIDCGVCKKSFVSTLRLTGYFYKTCDECRCKINKQGAKYRSDLNFFIEDLK